MGTPCHAGLDREVDHPYPSPQGYRRTGGDIAMLSHAAAPVTIPLDATPSFRPGLAVTSDGRRLYVTTEDPNPDTATVKVIDTATNTVIATIPVGNVVRGVAITPDGRAAYVLGLRVIHVIDTATNAVTTTISVAGPGAGVTGIAIAQDGRHAYVTVDEAAAGTVQVVDTATHTVTTTIDVFGFPWGIALTPDGRRAYVSHSGDGAAMIDLTTKETTFVDLSGEFRMAFTPDNRRAYLAPNDTQEVLEIDLTTHDVTLAAIPPGHSTDVAITPDGRHAYVTLRSRAGASVNGVISIDTATNKIVGPPVSWSATALPTAIALAGGHAYVLDRSARAVVVIPILRDR